MIRIIEIQNENPIARSFKTELELATNTLMSGG